MEIKLLSETQISRANLEAFLQEIDADFVPPLSTRTNLSAYAGRLWNESINLVVTDEETTIIRGLCSFYCTPGLYEFASLSLLAVHPTARGMSFGQKMLERCKEYVTVSGMNVICTRTWLGNAHMIRILESCSFEFTGETMDWDKRISRNYCWQNRSMCMG